MSAPVTQAELMRVLRNLTNAAAGTTGFASPMFLKDAQRLLARVYAEADASSDAARLRDSLETIEYYTHTHCTAKHALDGINAIREEAQSVLKGDA